MWIGQRGAVSSEARGSTDAASSEIAKASGGRRAPVAWWRHLALALILVVSGSLVRWGQEDESPTEDEFAHLTRGIVYWTTGDTRLSYAHPPLANALVTIGVAGDDDIPDITTFTRSFDQRIDTGSVASGLLKKDYPSMRDKLLRARQAMTWIFLVGVAYAYFWALRIVGWPAAVAAAVFVGFNPSIIAQARYVTTDLPAGVAIAMAAGEFSRYLAGDGGRHTTWVTMPLALAGAILSKHSAALLAPMFVVVGGVVVLARAGIFREQGRLRGLLRFAGHGAFAAVVAVLAINAAYRFQHTGLTVDEILERPEPRYWISSPYEGQLLEEMTPLPKLPGSLRIPLPYTELFGLGCIRAQNERGYPMASFRGEPGKMGHWLYFPTLLLFKTPIVVLVLVLIGGPLALWRLRMRPPLAVTVVAVLALMFLAMSMRSNLNMGFRHALPVETMLCMVAAAIWGGALAWLGDAPWRRAGLWLAVAGVAYVGIGAGPHYLGWYNDLVGRERGHQINSVGDDWGQDRKQFVELVQRYHLQPLHYDQQTSARQLEVKLHKLRYTPIKCRKMPPEASWVAIHLQSLQARPSCFKYLEGLEPVFRVNDHIHVYWLPPGHKKGKKRGGKAKKGAKAEIDPKAAAKAKAEQKAEAKAPEPDDDAKAGDDDDELYAEERE